MVSLILSLIQSTTRCYNRRDYTGQQLHKRSQVAKEVKEKYEIVSQEQMMIRLTRTILACCETVKTYHLPMALRRNHRTEVAEVAQVVDSILAVGPGPYEAVVPEVA
jgi:hypothetical protein